MKPDVHPPRWAKRLLTWLHPEGTLEEVEGDLDELYAFWYQRTGKSQATLRYLLNVISVLPPFVRQRQRKETYPSSTQYLAMIRNYLKIAFRNLTKNKAYSFINIGGFAVGMAVAMLIGLWIYDELSFDKYHQNYDRIAQVMQNRTFNGEVRSDITLPPVLAAELRNSYGANFKFVVQASWNSNHLLAVGDEVFTKKGNYFDPQVADMLSLNMLEGTRAGLADPYSIFLSESVAKAYFGDTDPLGKTIKIDNKVNVSVSGVYEDLPYNSTFNDLSYILPWELYLIMNPFIKAMPSPWDGNFTQAFVQISDNADMNSVSATIRDVKLHKVSPKEAKSKPEVFLQPMRNWHLNSEFKNGKNAGGRIEFVWLFGIIGLLVALLACINFMNLATARSEKRAREVGVRKALGSAHGQLISQFFAESLLVVFIAFVVSLLIVILALPFFNELADKKIAVAWTSPLFWGLCLAFSLITGVVAGSYPAFYLSSFQPIKVLKGTIQVGRFAAVPRKALVVFQFTVSIALIIGTIIVFRQIEFAKKRPVGYNRNGLIRMNLSGEVAEHFETVRAELKHVKAIDEMALSGSPLTSVWVSNGGFDWEGKDPNLTVDFPNNAVSASFGKTVGWKIQYGRDFSDQLATDSSGLIINEAAVAFMGLKGSNGGPPIGKTIKWGSNAFVIIGIVKDLVVESPYAPIRPSIYNLSNEPKNFIILRMNQHTSSGEALRRMAEVFKKYTPEKPFEYSFVDEEYAKKFSQEQRIGKLASVFAVLAIVISCLGLFGLASFMAEARTKEIGIRKVLGASALSLWGMLSKDFMTLVVISFCIATPIAYYFLSDWLQNYEYRTDISWWIFALAGLGALAVTLLTVSYQSIRAALMNPVRSLRSE